MEAMKNIILLDDHIIIRNGLKELIEKLGPFRISCQFDNGQEFLDVITQKPETDLIIMDINMPGMNGDEVVEKLFEKRVKIPVLVLTVSQDESLVIKLFRLGVRGYLKKNCKAEELKNALNEIFDTGYYHNEFLTFSLQTNLSEKEKNTQEIILSKLSVREREFLKLVCNEKEYTYEQIADLMGIHTKTVQGFRESIFDKFGIKSKTGLVLFVLRHKLFEQL
ncbi:MAG TPA: response regulator transcription factor [Bacteroidia bacterium]|jgi:two-component system invasion response regulator UvrY|nr:response regulator transcription factor [Bacteroidia bacterium]